MIKSIAEAKQKRAKDKEKRVAAAIANDFKEVLKVLNLTIDALGHFKRYVPVMEVLSTVQTNRTLIEIQLKKYERQLEKDETNKLETT